MIKPNNVVTIPAKSGVDFFRKWFVYLKPLHNLTTREIDIAAELVNNRFELSKVIKDDTLLDKVAMNKDSKNRICESCGITQEHFQVALGKLRKGGIIIDNKINPLFIPSLNEENKTFQLLLYFKLDEVPRPTL